MCIRDRPPSAPSARAQLDAAPPRGDARRLQRHRVLVGVVRCAAPHHDDGQQGAHAVTRRRDPIPHPRRIS
eukprot:1781882-Prymnesium_polylepis.1